MDNPLSEKSPNLERITAALAYASRAHRGQRRKGADAAPYINHPIEVMAVLVSEVGIADCNIICAALLHDTIEDTDVTLADLRELFGTEVADIVAEISDDKTLKSAERKQLQIEHARRLSHGAKIIKLADKICNLRDIGDSPPVGWGIDRQRAYFDWSKQVIEGLRGAHSELEVLFDQVFVTRP